MLNLYLEYLLIGTLNFHQKVIFSVKLIKFIAELVEPYRQGNPTYLSLQTTKSRVSFPSLAII